MTRAEKKAKDYSQKVWRDGSRKFDSLRNYSETDYLAGFKAAVAELRSEEALRWSEEYIAGNHCDPGLDAVADYLERDE